MKQLHVEMENCYGIKKLKEDFNFDDNKVRHPRVYAIYAPNGAMKSSFAKAFKDASEGVPSKDRIYSDRVTRRVIVDENGKDIPKDSIFVVYPYDEALGHTKKTCLLLVNEKLKAEYDKINESVSQAENTFVEAMKEQSKSKKEIKREISWAFTQTYDSFYLALRRVKDEVEEQSLPWADLDYDTVFDEKVLAILEDKDMKSRIGKYVSRLNELLDASLYFKKGVFNYYNGATVAKQLAEHGFFDAKHTVRLNATETIEIASRKQLEQLIDKEKEQIAKDKELRKKYEEIDKQLRKNMQCRDFDAYLTNHEELLPKLENIAELRQEVWKSYFKTRFVEYQDLLDKYQKAEKRRKEIEAQAAKERTQWQAVIEIFNDRFVVPFTLNIKNQIAVTLASEGAIVLDYSYNDGDGERPVEKRTLLESLSTGEKKSLYILNIIFEVEARKKQNTETLFVFDDIADSFDYRNKYAIIQYMQDICDEPNFRQIILTHNFDFFRTIHSRFVSWKHCKMAFRSSEGLKLEPADGINNVFVNIWKGEFFSDQRKKLASIPFIRNIVEYTKGKSDSDYAFLTSLLHWKPDSGSRTIDELNDLFARLFNESAPPKGTKAGKALVVDAIIAEADKCLSAPEGLNLDIKVLLAIAIRLVAEQFMVKKINDQPFMDGIGSNQTQELLTRFKTDFPNENVSIRALQNVALMTPENIHLNSFMYEPLVDMSDEHLRKLYKQVKAIK